MITFRIEFVGRKLKMVNIWSLGRSNSNELRLSASSANRSLSPVIDARSLSPVNDALSMSPAIEARSLSAFIDTRRFSPSIKARRVQITLLPPLLTTLDEWRRLWAKFIARWFTMLLKNGFYNIIINTIFLVNKCIYQLHTIFNILRF